MASAQACTQRLLYHWLTRELYCIRLLTLRNRPRLRRNTRAADMDKSQAVPSGRVPLVQDGKPLLYFRYNKVDDLVKLAKGSPGPETNGGNDDGATAVNTTERPNKKQKRSSTAATNDADVAQQPADASPPPSIYAVVGEDGLTYKQRRQLRRAQERAAKEQVQAEAEAAKSGDDGPAAAPEDAPQPAPSPASAAGIDKPRKKSKKGGDSSTDEPQPPSANDVTTSKPPVAVAKGGNADEAARIRAVLGFTTGAGSGGVGAAGAGLRLGSLVQSAAVKVDENGAAGAGTGRAGESAKKRKKEKEDSKVAEDTQPEQGTGKHGVTGKGVVEGTVEDMKDTESKKKDKKKDKEKKKKKKAEEAAQESGGAGTAAEQRQQQQAAEAVSNGHAGASAAGGAGFKGAKGGKGADAVSRDGATGTSGRMHFSFDFKVQAAVEAETEAKVARLMALDASKDGFVPRRVWVCGLPHEYDETTLYEYWSYCGEVEDMHCLAFPDSGNFNGTAFITFKTQEGYEAALACHGEMLEGRALRVEKCKAAAALKCKARSVNGSGPAANPADAATSADGDSGDGDAGQIKKDDGGQKGAGKVQGGGKAGVGARVAGYPVVYVGNVAFEAGAEQLSALFAERVGSAPNKVRLHTDPVTGRSKGFAHVHFTSEEEVDTAITLDGTNLHGRKIRVSYAQPKPGEV